MTPLPDDVAKIIRLWTAQARDQFTSIRQTIHLVADRAEVGDLLETLKWGQPSWLPAKPRIGTTLRCNWVPALPHRLSLYVHCQTNLVETIKTIYPSAFEYEGSRALHIDLNAPPPEQVIDHCALLTLSYHRKTT